MYRKKVLVITEIIYEHGSEVYVRNMVYLKYDSQ
jgi:hypothetical protein